MKFYIKECAWSEDIIKYNQYFTSIKVDTDDIRNMSDEDLMGFILEVAYTAYRCGCKDS